MSLIYTEGFEDGLAAGGFKTAPGTAWSGVDVAYGRNGKGGWNDSGTTLGIDIPVADQHDTMIVGFAMRHTSAHNSGAGGQMGFFSDAGATQHVRWSFGTNTYDMSLSYGPTAAGVVLSLLPNYFYYIEVKARLHDTLGSVQIKVNGVTVFNVSNVDTKNGGTKTVFDHYRINTSVISPVRRHIDIDDFYLCNGAGSVNNDFLGDIAIETLFPNADGAFSNFVGSDSDSVANYALVNEQGAPSMSSFVGGSNVGDKDLYNIDSPVRTAGPILGAVITAYVQNGDSGSRAMGIIVKSGSTTTTPTGTTLVTTPAMVRKVLDVDPADGAQMTIADAVALQIGVEITA